MSGEQDYRIDHYYSIEDGEGEIEEGHIFCTPAEGEAIEAALKAALPDYVEIEVEPGGEYDYSTEESPAATIAADIVSQSGFQKDDEA